MQSIDEPHPIGSRVLYFLIKHHVTSFRESKLIKQMTIFPKATYIRHNIISKTLLPGFFINYISHRGMLIGRQDLVPGPGAYAAHEGLAPEAHLEAKPKVFS